MTDYIALTQQAGLVRLENRTLVALLSSDRRQLLHNFCSADINSLPDGSTTEAFVLNGKGKILAHVLVMACDDELLLSGTPGQAETLMQHLDQYIIREDVRLENRSPGQSAIFVRGEQAHERLAPLVERLPEKNQVSVAHIDQWLVHFTQVEIAGWGFLILANDSVIDGVAGQLVESGIVQCGLDTLHRVRIEEATPWYGIDLDDRNLPQELQRDNKAISFTKGCYLGQETVARIDAIGRVNQLLVRIEISQAEDVAPGDELTVDGKIVGRITSACPTGERQWIGLGYVKRAFAKPGTELDSATSKFKARVG